MNDKCFLVFMNLVLHLPFLEYFTFQGSDEGVGSVFHSALLRFPLDYSSFIQFSAALAESTPTSAERASLSWKKNTLIAKNLSFLNTLKTSQM